MNFTVQGDMERSDYVKYWLKQVKYFPAFMFLWSAVSSHLLLSMFTELGGFPSLGWLLLSVALFASIFLVALLFKLRQIKKNPIWLERKEILINETGIRQEQVHETWNIKWEDIVKVTETHDYVSIILNTWINIIIPKRFFADTQEANRAVEYIKSKAGKKPRVSVPPENIEERYVVQGKVKRYEYYGIVLEKNKKGVIFAFLLPLLFYLFNFLLDPAPLSIVWIYRWVLLKAWIRNSSVLLLVLYGLLFLMGTILMERRKGFTLRTYAFTDQGIKITSSFSTRWFSWEDAMKWQVKRKVLTIRYPDTNVWLLSRYFESERQKQEVLSFIEGKLGEGKA